MFLDPGLDAWVDGESFGECVGTFLKACELIQNVVLLEHFPPWLYDSAYVSEEDRESELKIYGKLCNIIADRVLDWKCSARSSRCIPYQIVEIRSEDCLHGHEEG